MTIFQKISMAQKSVSLILKAYGLSSGNVGQITPVNESINGLNISVDKKGICRMVYNGKLYTINPTNLNDESMSRLKKYFDRKPVAKKIATAVIDSNPQIRQYIGC